MLWAGDRVGMVLEGSDPFPIAFVPHSGQGDTGGKQH